MQTRSQKLAQKAIEVVSAWKNASGDKDPNQFARRFPALVQTSGLLQAVAFARDKNDVYAEGFRSVLGVLARETVGKDLPEFERNLSESSAVDYMRVSRLALEAATWIKRYVATDDKTSADETSQIKP